MAEKKDFECRIADGGFERMVGSTLTMNRFCQARNSKHVMPKADPPPAENPNQIRNSNFRMRNAAQNDETRSILRF